MNIIIFLDNLSRTVIGEMNEKLSTDTKLAVNNPAILDIAPNAEGRQLQLRMIPILFKEFQANKDEAVTWHYNRDHVVMSENIDLDFRIIAQYQQMFSNIALPPGGTGNIITPNGNPASNANSDVIKLFDD